ncbi:MAG TPA: thioredoxin [Marinagarivorans sp.]
MSNASEHIVDITYDNAKQYLIDESMVRPVLVDFWADWCGPCKSLMPILEKLAVEYAGAFLLAKVNADELQQLAGQFGVQSLPTLMVMQNGQPVDGVQGAQPEAAIRELLAKYLPAPWEATVQQGLQKVEQGEGSEGVALLRSAYQESGQDVRVALALASGLISTRRLNDASEILATIKMVDQGPEYHQLMAQLELAQNAAKAPEITELEARHEANPGDLDVIQALAAQYSQHQHNEEALALLWGVLQKDLNAKDGELKRIYMDVLASVGKGDPLSIRYQQKLYAMLY